MRHPPLQPGWIDTPHYRASLGRFELESGDFIDNLELSYVVHGDLSDTSRPVALGLCAIGSTHHRLDFLIGHDRAFDPAQFSVIVVDAIGNGLSSSPSTSPSQPGRVFPRFTLRDMVRSQKALLEHLGLERVQCVIGASMGGMQALQWGVSYPDFMRDIVAMTPMAKTASWAAAMNHAGRLALEAGGGSWEAWVSIMQVVAMRTPARFGRDVPDPADVRRWIEERTAWWTTQQFDPTDWIYQSWAYDAHDVGRTPGFDGDTARALNAISARTLICAPELDLYNPVESAEWAARHIPRCTFLKIASDSGHLMATDADPEGARRLNLVIGRFIRATSEAWSNGTSRPPCV
jgi:homoserine O-acetyltransferase